MKPDITEKHATPGDIRAEIERTRRHMDENLASLGRKFSMGWHGRLPKLAIPLAGIFLAGMGAVIFQKLRRPKSPWYARKGHSPIRPVVKAAGLVDQFLLMRTLILSARKGKPAIYVVQPGKR